MGAPSKDEYAKGWEQGVRHSLSVLSSIGDLDEARRALSTELLRLGRPRNRSRTGRQTSDRSG